MKRIFLIVILVFVVFLSKAQENSLIPIEAKKSFIGYNFLLEGTANVSVGAVIYGIPFPGIGIDIVNGIRLGKSNYLGIGIGFFSDGLVMMQSVPIYLNYRYVLKSKTDRKGLINLSAGINFGGTFLDNSDNYRGYGIYGSLSGGFVKNRFSFSAGPFARSVWGTEIWGVEIKCGFTFSK